MSKENQPDRKNVKDDESDRSSRSKSSKRKPFSCRVAIFDKVNDPNKRTMYPKHLVYADGKDIQLEEIRARNYWNKVRGPRGDWGVDQITKSFRDMSTQTEPEAEKITRVLEACTQTETENSHSTSNVRIPTISPAQSQHIEVSIPNEQSTKKTSTMVLSSQSDANDANISNVQSSQRDFSVPKSRCPNVMAVLTRQTEESELNVQPSRENAKIPKSGCANITMVLARHTTDTESKRQSIQPREKIEIIKSGSTDKTVIFARHTEDPEPNVQSNQESSEILESEFSNSPNKVVLVDGIEPTQSYPEAEVIVSNLKLNHKHEPKSIFSKITTRSSARAKLGSRTRSAPKRNTQKAIEEELPNLPIFPTPSRYQIEAENLLNDEDDSLNTKALKMVPSSTPTTPFEKTKNKNQAKRKKVGKYFSNTKERE